MTTDLSTFPTGRSIWAYQRWKENFTKKMQDYLKKYAKDFLIEREIKFIKEEILGQTKIDVVEFMDEMEREEILGQ